MSSPSDELSFEADIKPMFREGDRDAMEWAFDLWSYDDVSSHADAILGTVADGSMPCDGGWPKEQVDRLRAWIEAGKPA
jgi:hypothetical protein